jgi:hypothetical protein
MFIRIKHVPKAKLGLPISHCFTVPNTINHNWISGEKNVNKISNAKWAMIAAQAKKRKSVDLPTITSFTQISNFRASR